MATPTGSLQVTRTLRAKVPGTASGADVELAIGRNDFGAVATVTAVRYLADATLTGAATNTRAITVSRRTAGGTATTIATLQFNSGVNATAYASTPITLSGTATNLDVPAGDILTFTSTHIGTGLADPGGTIEVDLQRA
jgi:hypothetical protein